MASVDGNQENIPVQRPQAAEISKAEETKEMGVILNGIAYTVGASSAEIDLVKDFVESHSDLFSNIGERMRVAQKTVEAEGDRVLGSSVAPGRNVYGGPKVILTVTSGTENEQRERTTEFLVDDKIIKFWKDRLSGGFSIYPSTPPPVPPREGSQGSGTVPSQPQTPQGAPQVGASRVSQPPTLKAAPTPTAASSVSQLRQTSQPRKPEPSASRKENKSSNTPQTRRQGVVVPSLGLDEKKMVAARSYAEKNKGVVESRYPKITDLIAHLTMRKDLLQTADAHRGRELASKFAKYCAGKAANAASNALEKSRGVPNALIREVAEAAKKVVELADQYNKAGQSGVVAEAVIEAQIKAMESVGRLEKAGVPKTTASKQPTAAAKPAAPAVGQTSASVRSRAAALPGVTLDEARRTRLINYSRARSARKPMISADIRTELESASETLKGIDTDVVLTADTIGLGPDKRDIRTPIMQSLHTVVATMSDATSMAQKAGLEIEAKKTWKDAGDLAEQLAEIGNVWDEKKPALNVSELKQKLMEFIKLADEALRRRDTINDAVQKKSRGS